MNIAFFGTPHLAVNALLEMETFGIVPKLIVTMPDAPIGRKHVLTPPPTKVWAEERSIPVFQPESLKHKEDLTLLTSQSFDVFVVFAYGKIIPEWLLSVPTHGTINAHPSLLPKLRGASPIRSTLLQDLSACGVTIIQMDAEMDHGPILYQQPVTLESPIPGRELDKTLSLMCGDLLAHVITELPKGTLTPKPQDHNNATLCGKITKDMAELALDPYSLPSGEMALETYRKICAFDEWPEAFFIHEGKRIKIKSAQLDQNANLLISRITPEGKNEMNFAEYFKH